LKHIHAALALGNILNQFAFCVIEPAHTGFAFGQGSKFALKRGCRIGLRQVGTLNKVFYDVALAHLRPEFASLIDGRYRNVKVS
jgi:hypothetical protein